MERSVCSSTDLFIREATPRDVNDLRDLYLRHLTKTPPEQPGNPAEWETLLARLTENKDYHLLVGEADGRAVSSVTLIVIDNLTHGLRPYALIENVVTHESYRGHGYAGALLTHAAEIARERGCYKIMLMTGSKEESTLRFYERCGFSRERKTAFLMEL